MSNTMLRSGNAAASKIVPRQGPFLGLLLESTSRADGAAEPASLRNGLSPASRKSSVELLTNLGSATIEWASSRASFWYSANCAARTASARTS